MASGDRSRHQKESHQKDHYSGIASRDEHTTPLALCGSFSVISLPVSLSSPVVLAAVISVDEV